MQCSAPVLKTIPVCATYSCPRDSRYNLSVDDSRSSQSLSLLLLIILGSVVKTTSLQVTAKTMKTILCPHRVQRHSCPSPKGSNSRNLEFVHRRTQCRRQEHNQRRPGRLSKACPCRSSFTNAKKMAAYINVSPAILRLYLLYKF